MFYSCISEIHHVLSCLYICKCTFQEKKTRTRNWVPDKLPAMAKLGRRERTVRVLKTY